MSAGAVAKLLAFSLVGVASDFVTTKIALRYPELREMNPNVNFPLEFLTSLGGGLGLYGLGAAMGQKKLGMALALVGPHVPIAAAINNTGWILLAHSRYYPWEEHPFLYPEVF